MDGSSNTVSSSSSDPYANSMFSNRLARNMNPEGSSSGPKAPMVKRRDDWEHAVSILTADQVKGFRDKLNWVAREWEKEIAKAEELLGSDGFNKLLQALDKASSSEYASLRESAEDLKKMLASRPVQKVLHTKVKRMETWNNRSSAILDAFRSDQTSHDMMNGRRQSIIYYSWALTSAARAATFIASIYTKSAALTNLTITCTVAVPVLAAFHTATMIRDVYRTEESFYKERAKAYENMDRAIRFMKNMEDPSPADSWAVLAFLDACKKIPELSPTARLEADKTYYAAMREKSFLPVNLLASATAQILNAIGSPSIGQTVTFGLSGLAYIGQAYCDGFQGSAEAGKAQEIRKFAQKWIERQDEELISQWRTKDDWNTAVCEVVTRHMLRVLGQQGLELAGGVVREVKAGANVVSGVGSMQVALMQQLMRPAKPAPANLVGTFISVVSTAYMTFTATKMYKRGDEVVNSKHRREDARLTEALLGTDELIALMCQENLTVGLRLVSGTYDERSGFPYTHKYVSPYENEYLALGLLARQVSEVVNPDTPEGKSESVINDLRKVWGTPEIELAAMQAVARGIPDERRRIDFIKYRLSSRFKAEYPLATDPQRGNAGSAPAQDPRRAPALPSEVLVDIAIKKLATHGGLKKTVKVPADPAPKDRRGALKHLSESYLNLKGTFFNRFDEDDFLIAMDQVWATRTPSRVTSDAKTGLYHARLLADYIVDLREQRGIAIMTNLLHVDGKQLRVAASKNAADALQEQVRIYLNAEIQLDRKAKAGAATKLSHMPLVQRLISEARDGAETSDQGLLSDLECSKELKYILAELDIDTSGGNVEDDDSIVSAADSDDTSSDDSEFDDTDDGARGGVGGKNSDVVIDLSKVLGTPADHSGTASDGSDDSLLVEGADSSSDDSISSNESNGSAAGRKADTGPMNGDSSSTPPRVTRRHRARLVQKLFGKEKARRGELMTALDFALKSSAQSTNGENPRDAFSQSTTVSKSE
ncbi:hypothetical protein [Lacisediminimonas profundi]|uniref:hypothetical protein n=1 Tax=Lacisediminimonas profundi TaxID=2603856 RepID=UPI00124B31EA|nr:hypothetical protein [Lacisediminimonas profundi]